MNFNINTDSLFETLPIMGKGMFGIFVVTAVIVISMILLNKLSNK